VSRRLLIARHPCYSLYASRVFARIHVPVAPRCNLGCFFCLRERGGGWVPGEARTVLAPREAAELVKKIVERSSGLTVVAIAGPGDALASPEALEFLELIRDLRGVIRCLSTNGVLVEEMIERLASLGVQAVTISMHAYFSETAAQIYRFLRLGDGRVLRGVEAGREIVSRQLRAIELCRKRGMLVKVNSVHVPGLNDRDIVEIAREAAARGADLMNIIPVIPGGDPLKTEALRRVCSSYIEQMTWCQHCRADAFGYLGSRKTLFDVVS